MMKLIKPVLFFLVLNVFSISLFAQDAVIISDGNFLRGTIKGTDFSSVKLLQDDQTLKEFKAKDIKEFLWNGSTYVSMPILVKKKMEHRFLRLEESGAVNFYSMGNTSTGEEPARKRVQVRPSVGVGLGTGGYGGFGVGGGITFGGGRGRNNKGGSNQRGVTYYLEKPGSGPLVELPVKGNSASDNEQIRQILLQKFTNDEELAERIKATEHFDAKSIQALVAAYNVMQK